MILGLVLSAVLYLLVLFSLSLADSRLKKKKAPVAALDRRAPFGYNSCIYGRLRGGKGE
jgi:hypothetical protein